MGSTLQFDIQMFKISAFAYSWILINTYFLTKNENKIKHKKTKQKKKQKKKTKQKKKKKKKNKQKKTVKPR